MSIDGHPMPLLSRPVARAIGVGHHGIRGKVESYHMLGQWCLHFYNYTAEFKVNDHWYTITPGSISLTPPDARLQYQYRSPCEHLYAHFELLPAMATALAPVMQIPGDQFERLQEGMREAVGWFASQRDRAEIRLWDILWSLTSPLTNPLGGSAHEHPAVEKVKQTIELGLNRPLRMAKLAEESGLSHNHLIRLFRAATGTSLIQYVRRRRIEQAIHLLGTSTMPIKAVAAQVGIPDLHLFNKTIRQSTRLSPRAYRNASKSSPKISFRPRIDR